MVILLPSFRKSYNNIKNSRKVKNPLRLFPPIFSHGTVANEYKYRTRQEILNLDLYVLSIKDNNNDGLWTTKGLQISLNQFNRII